MDKDTMTLVGTGRNYLVEVGPWISMILEKTASLISNSFEIKPKEEVVEDIKEDEWNKTLAVISSFVSNHDYGQTEYADSVWSNDYVTKDVEEVEKEEESFEPEVEVSKDEGYGGFKNYQTILDERIDELYLSDTDKLKDILRSYGYSDGEIKKILTSSDLVKEAIQKEVRIIRVNNLLEIKMNFQLVSDKLSRLGYESDEIDIITKDEKLVNDAYTYAYLRDTFGISEEYFERIIDVNLMYYKDKEGFIKALMDRGYTEEESELVMKNREVAQNAILYGEVVKGSALKLEY